MVTDGVSDFNRTQTARRDDLFTHIQKTLILLNGGASIALLAFIQSIWTEPTALNIICYILYSMIALSIGMTFSVISYILRYCSTESYQYHYPSATRFTNGQKITTALGLSSFPAAMAIVLFGMIRNIPQ